jgi:NitT/TauT family transport system substrate-binding protein
MRPAIFSALYLAAALVGYGSVDQASATDKVNVGLGGSSVDTPFYLARDKGFFKDEDIDVNFIVFASGAGEIAPLGTGELDVGSGAASVGLYNAIARGVGIRVVADKGHTAPGYQYQSLIVRKSLIDSGEFKSLKDLKGKRVGMAAQGVTTLSYLNQAAKAGGISFSDVTPVFMPMPDQVAAMKNDALDASILPEPPGTLIVDAGIGVRFMNTEDFYPYGEVTMVFYGEKFLQEKPELARRFMRAYLRGVRAYNDTLKEGRVQASATDMVALMVKYFKLTPELVTKMYAPAVDPNGMIQVKSMQKDLDFFREQGWVKQPIDLTNVIDMSIAEKASADLGPYVHNSN